MLTGLNAVYGVSENRGYIYTRSISVVYTFVFILILLLTLVLHVFGNSIINLMRQVDNPVVIFFTDLIDLRFFLLLFLQSLVFTLMFMVLPNKRRSRFMESLPGGVLSSLGWLVFSDIYSLRGEFLQIFHDLRLGVRHCHHHAVAVLLYEHPVLRRGAEPVSDG